MVPGVLGARRFTSRAVGTAYVSGWSANSYLRVVVEVPQRKLPFVVRVQGVER